MNRHWLMLIGALLLASASACSTKQDPIDDLKDLASELVENGNEYSDEQWEEESQKLMDHEEVKELLVNEGFNTEDMKTSYWYLEENKLMFVAAGEKDKCKIEFYQYNDGETTNGVYNTISYNFNQDLEFKERENYEKELENGGKIFEMDVDGKYNVVAFKDNTVVYGYCQAKDKSIVKEIVEEIGYK